VGAPAQAYGNLGGAQVGRIEGIPQLAGWRVTTGGVIIPRRRPVVSNVTAVAPNAGSVTQTIPVNLGMGFQTTPAALAIAPNTGVLIELCSISAANLTNDLKTSSIAAATLFASLATAGDAPTDNIKITLPVLPPTLNIPRLGGVGIQYAQTGPYAIHYDDIVGAIQVMAGSAIRSGIQLFDLFWLLVIDNTGAVSNNIGLTTTCHYRFFEGVTTA